MALETKWFILHTYSGYENKVAADIMKVVENRSLQHLIETLAVPTVKRIETKDNGKIVEVEDKIYPGYVFVKMVPDNNDAWYICRNTRGVTGFVGPESKPTPLSEQEVINLENALANKDDNQEAKMPYAVGDEVIISQGLFEGFEGKITDMDNAQQTVTIDVVNMFGEVTPTTVSITAISKKS